MLLLFIYFAWLIKTYIHTTRRSVSSLHHASCFGIIPHRVIFVDSLFFLDWLKCCQYKRVVVDAVVVYE